MRVVLYTVMHIKWGPQRGHAILTQGRKATGWGAGVGCSTRGRLADGWAGCL